MLSPRPDLQPNYETSREKLIPFPRERIRRLIPTRRPFNFAPAAKKRTSNSSTSLRKASYDYSKATPPPFTAPSSPTQNVHIASFSDDKSVKLGHSDRNGCSHVQRTYRLRTSGGSQSAVSDLSGGYDQQTARKCTTPERKTSFCR